MHDQRNTKKWLFFEAQRDQRESRLGVKMCLFLRKRVILDSTKGRLGVIFQIPPNMSPQKSLFRGKFERKSCKILIQEEVFLEREIAIRVCFENLWSLMCTTLVFECPPPGLYTSISIFLLMKENNKLQCRVGCCCLLFRFYLFQLFKF